MIKINLLETKKEGMNIPVIMGLDPSKISWVGVILSIIVYFGSQEAVKFIYKDKINIVDEKIKIEDEKIRKITANIKKHKRIKTMLTEFETKKEQLKTKTKHVTQILENKSNPRKILERLAKDVGTDLWFQTIRVSNDNITIEGSAYNYSSIGSFINRANESRFFGQSLRILNDKVKTETITIRGQRTTVERFVVQGKIISYE